MSFDRAALASAVALHEAVVRVLVAETAGSVPREPGTTMLVWADGQSGTIGGGALEFAAAATARGLLSDGGARIDRHPLGPGLGQCCGGAVTLVSEVWDQARMRAVPVDGAVLRRVAGAAEAPLALTRAARSLRGEGAVSGPLLQDGWLLETVSRPVRQVWIWGAGHVGRALVSVLAPLPEIALHWVDTAPDRFPDAVAEGVTCLPAADPVLLAARTPEDAEHLIVTFSHALDLALCDALLGRPARFIGLIGSATKRTRFRRRLAELGHPPERIDRITCPIGEPALGKAPQAIAIGVAAALLTPVPNAATEKVRRA